MKLIHSLFTCLLFLLSPALFAADFSLPANTWKMISLPSAPPEDKHTIKQIFGDDIAGQYQEEWALFEYDTQNKRYREMSDSDRLEQGKGYWIIQIASDTVTLDMPEGSTDGTPVSVPLTSSDGQEGQWNMVGSPFPSPRSLSDLKIKGTDICIQGCDLNEAKQQGLAHNQAWFYNGTDYDALNTTDTVNPWEGLWVYALPGSSGHNLSWVSGTDHPADGLQLKIVDNGHGISMTSLMTHDGTELLSPDSPPLFKATIQNTNAQNEAAINAEAGWGSVKIVEDGDQTRVTLSDPTVDELPSSLRATITARNKGNQLVWDMQLEGAGDTHTIKDVTFPQLAIKAGGNDHFFAPHHFGQVFDNPGSTLNYTEGYPIGFSAATMQYMAYYNQRYGLYFGFHDPDASPKTFQATHGDKSVTVAGKTLAANHTLAGNDWAYPGEFALTLYQGDWYEAAMHYKNWVGEHANYRVNDSRERNERFRKFASVDVWTTQAIWDKNHKREFKATDISRIMGDLKDQLDQSGTDIMMGAYWLAPYGHLNEYQFPEFIPSETTKTINQNLTEKYRNHNIQFSIYTNGYLYDEQIENPRPELPAFSEMRASAALQENKRDIWEQDWEGPNGSMRPYARMCPTQARWQDILANMHRTYLSPMNLQGVLLDQVTAATNEPCYNVDHHHPLGGGHYWRDGNVALIHKLRTAYHDNRYFVSEAFNDSLVNEIEGYETLYFVDQNQVPAVQAVYGDKVEFIGPRSGTGTYDADNSENLYGTQALTFAYGNIPGYFYPDLAQPGTDTRQRALAYVRKLATLRHKLREFVAYGQMQKPLELPGAIPALTIPKTGHTPSITISAIQSSVWKNSGNKLALVFVNARTPDSGEDPISFTLDFDGAKYGLTGSLSLTEVTETTTEELGEFPTRFNREITLPSADVKGYIISSRQ